MGNDRISIIHEVTMDTLATIKSNTQSVTPEEVRSQIMENVRGAVRLENIVREKGEKIRLLLQRQIGQQKYCLILFPIKSQHYCGFLMITHE